MQKNLHWRSPARVVACLDLAIASIKLVVVVYESIWFGILTTNIRETKASESSAKTSQINHQYEEYLLRWVDDLQRDAIIKVTIETIRMKVGVRLIWEIIHLYAAINLLCATKIGMDPKKSYGLAQIWLVVAIISIVMETIYVLLFGIYRLNSILFLIRLCFPNHVRNFLKELKPANPVNNAIKEAVEECEEDEICHNLKF